MPARTRSNWGPRSLLSRFGIPDWDDDRKEKGDSNGDDGDRDGGRDRRSLGISVDHLSFGVDGVHDTLEGMPTHRVELARSMSLKKSHILSGSIFTHLSSQGSWSIGSGAAALFCAWFRSRINSNRSRNSIFSYNKPEEEQGLEASTATAPEGENFHQILT